MNMKEAVISVLKNWNDFTGRASRSEFWYFCLAYFLIAIAVSFVDIASGTADLESGQMEMIDMTFGQMGIASVILNLFLLVPLCQLFQGGCRTEDTLVGGNYLT